MRAVIIAAAQGTRLWERTSGTPKTLLPFGRGTILSHILDSFRVAGISEFIIVVGFQAQLVRQYVNGQNDFGLNITIVDNDRWRGGNCLSACAAQALLRPRETWLLSMSDHIVTPDALRQMAMFTSPQNLLLVDPGLADVYDIEDATKVRLEDGRLMSIGKDLRRYNAVDCGIFRFNSLFLASAKACLAEGREALTDTVRSLIETDEIAPVVISPDSHWIDVDTPEAYALALSQQEIFLQSLA